MDMNRFTEKSQEALQGAQRLAARLNHQQIDVEHLLLALLDQERGLASALLTKAEIPVDAVKLRLHRELEKLPRVTGTSDDNIGITGRLNRLLGKGEEEAKSVKDEFVSPSSICCWPFATTQGRLPRFSRNLALTARA